MTLNSCLAVPCPGAAALLSLQESLSYPLPGELLCPISGSGLHYRFKKSSLTRVASSSMWLPHRLGVSWSPAFTHPSIHFFVLNAPGTLAFCCFLKCSVSSPPSLASVGFRLLFPLIFAPLIPSHLSDVAQTSLMKPPTSPQPISPSVSSDKFLTVALLFSIRRNYENLQFAITCRLVCSYLLSVFRRRWWVPRGRGPHLCRS